MTWLVVYSERRWQLVNGDMPAESRVVAAFHDSVVAEAVADTLNEVPTLYAANYDDLRSKAELEPF